MKLVVLDAATLGLPDEAWEPLTEFGEVDLFDRTEYDEAQVVERCQGAQVVLTNKVPLTAGVLSQLDSLELISVLATGYNNIDMVAARERGVTVCNVPAYSTEAVAQHTLALMLELCNRVALHDASVQAGDWCASPDFCYWLSPMRELREHTIGIVGMGKIGHRVGELCSAFGGRILGYSRRRKQSLNYESFAWASLEEIFQEADIVSLHCPQTEENAHFVDAALLATMKPTAFLINTARGSLIQEADLADALNQGVIAGAALDVVDGEPMRPECPLLGVPNCMITPHISWTSQQSREKMLRITLGNLRGYVNNHLINVVRA